MFGKIKSLFKKDVVNRDAMEKQMLYDHIIAIARLSMIKPSTLYKEARNIEANTEYLLKMAELMKS